MLYIGLMSGTSLDGINAVLASLEAQPALIASHYTSFSPALRSSIAALLRPGFDELARTAVLANELARTYAQAVTALLQLANTESSQVRAIGCHGQTVRHEPHAGYTVQVVNGALLAELCEINVVCDFRSRDIAAGGQGAPLVPAFHAASFFAPKSHRVIVNLGGIANVTYLPAIGEVTGFDCGPGNGLLDEWIGHRRGLAYDADGAWAASGQVVPELLHALLDHSFFRATPPKSTGRDVFSLNWIRPYLRPGYADADVQATLAELTARSLTDAISRWCAPTDEVFVCGGGAHNADLMRRIQALLSNKPLASTATLGIDPDWVEALAFAWLAREAVEGRCGNLAAVTGARGPRRLGCIYPA